jgi:hypothetical protein
MIDLKERTACPGPEEIAEAVRNPLFKNFVI